MKFNEWTLGLAAVGLVSLGSALQAEEAQNPISTALSSTTIGGYVNTSAIIRFGPSLPGDRYSTPGRSFDGNDKFNGFNLDVVKLQVEKPLDEVVFPPAINWAYCSVLTRTPTAPVRLARTAILGSRTPT